MPPRNMPLAAENSASNSHTYLTKRPDGIVHTSSLFNRQPQRTTTGLSTQAPSIRYRMPRKSQYTTEIPSRQQPSVIIRDYQQKRRRPDDPLCTLFDETSISYRTTLIDTAQTALVDARRALLHRLDASVDKEINTLGATRRAHTVQLSREYESADYIPTANELQDAHNTLITATTAPLSETSVSSEVKNDIPKDILSLGSAMADFAAVVAREDKRLRELTELWQRTRAELRLLAELLFGQAINHDVDFGRDSDVARLVAAAIEREGLSGAEMSEVNTLTKAVEQLAADSGRKVAEMGAREVEVDRTQTSKVMATFRQMQEDEYDG